MDRACAYTNPNTENYYGTVTTWHWGWGACQASIICTGAELEYDRCFVVTKAAISYNMSISMSIAASRLTRSSEGEPSGEGRHTSQLLSCESQDQNSLSIFWVHTEGNTTTTYITWIHDKILDWPSFIPFINRLDQQRCSLMRRGISANRFVRSFVGIRGHIIRAGPLGLSAVAWSQSSTFYLLGRRRTDDESSWREGDQDKTYRRGGTGTRQRHNRKGSRPHTK
jgi:hypothetical protein